MRLAGYILLLGLLLINSPCAVAQERLRYKGQLSAYSNLNPDNEYPWWNGIRYLPQLNLNIPAGNSRLIDFEASANLFGNAGTGNLQQWESNGRIKPYRLWARYSGNQFERSGGC
jgi:hypothetical protein